MSQDRKKREMMIFGAITTIILITYILILQFANIPTEYIRYANAGFFLMLAIFINILVGLNQFRWCTMVTQFKISTELPLPGWPLIPRYNYRLGEDWYLYVLTDDVGNIYIHEDRELPDDPMFVVDLDESDNKVLKTLAELDDDLVYPDDDGITIFAPSKRR